MSIITVCFNSETTIRDTIESVVNQKKVDLEHIIIDGASTDSTLSIINSLRHDKMIVVSEPDAGLYDAMNKGLKIATGDCVGVLNSDDFYKSETVLFDVCSAFTQGCDIVYGNVEFMSADSTLQSTRIVSPKKFQPWHMFFGWMPPHPATFIRRFVIDQVGEYNLNYTSAADFEYFIRIFLNRKFASSYINQIVVTMREGGITSSGFKSYTRTGKQMRAALLANGFYTNYFMLYMRLPLKYFFEKFLHR